MPLWILLALLAPTISAFISVCDKYFVDRFALNHYLFWIGVFELVVGSVFLVAANAEGVEFKTLWGGMLTGLVTFLSLVAMLLALQRGQVARVIPIWHMAPLMVAPMAAVFLEEQLSVSDISAILLAVSGAVLVTWQKGMGGRMFGSPAVPLLALLAAGLMAVSFIMSKYFLEEGGYWRFFGAFRVGWAPLMLTAGLLPRNRWGAISLMRQKQFYRPFIGMMAIASWSFIVRFAAIDKGPVSLVVAIGSLQPVLVFFYAFGLATAFPTTFGDWITKRTITTQIAGTVAIAAGVAIIAFR